MKNAKSKKQSMQKEDKPYLILELINRYYYFFLILVICIVGFDCFYHLGQFPARDWDEARHGVSAYEMIKNNNYIVNTYSYATDYWNLKPPLSFWGVLAGYKIFGFNLFGIRFYSALSFLLTVIMTSFFVQKRYGKPEALTVTLLISCCSPFYRYHFARHGDADALFLLFAVGTVFSAILIKENPKFLYLSGFLLSLSFLTKSWHSLFIIAVVGIYFITSKLLFQLNWKQWVLFFLSSSGAILLWLLIRYRYDGFQFIANMVNIDLLNRVGQPLEGHTGDVFYYIQLLFVFSPVTGLLPLCVAFCYGTLKLTGSKDAFSQMNPIVKRDFSVYLIWIFIPLLLFSIAQTKISWYGIPIFYSIVCLTGILIAQAMQCPKKYVSIQLILCGVLLLVVVSGFTGTLNDLKPAYQDTLQPYLANDMTAVKDTAKGKKAYIEIENSFTPHMWDQSYQLVGELYLDLNCQPGGLESFLADPKGNILLISKNLYTENQGSLQNYRILKSGTEYLCLEG